LSRLTDLIAQVKVRDSAVGQELEREFKVLGSRRSFGLNFERHLPETVELPGKPMRKGDKVRILPPRGSTTKGDQRLWKVLRLETANGTRLAQVEPLETAQPKRQQVAIEDIVVVAEFKDYIYPGLVSRGKVERGGSKPFHTVINAENFHALEALTFTHRGKVDLIYIDPPYNSGARDWKYNNDYVEREDLYRHSKWLAMIERRLVIAKDLLNLNNSALIVTIDEREYLRLGLLLEQIFPDANMQMISTLINSKGTGRANEFRRVDEYIYFLWFGDAKLGRMAAISSLPNVTPVSEKEQDDEEGDEEGIDEGGEERSPDRLTPGLDWQTFRRRDLASRRGTKKGGPRQFYPIYVNVNSGQIEAIGDPLPHSAPRENAPNRKGCEAVFPIRKDGTEMNWSTIGPTFAKRWKEGYARAGRASPNYPQKYIIQYLKAGSIKDIEDGRAVITGKNSDGSVIADYVEAVVKSPTTQWALKSHNAEHYGTGVLTSLIPGRTFPFPKSLYAVEDALRIFVADKPQAVVLDFFAGSGTTCHAVMRINRQDGQRRQCISVTNNEVKAEEQVSFRKARLRPGDTEWEKFGICDYITEPRIAAAITGKAHDGKEIDGSYKFADEFPMAEGFEANVEFFTLTYETPVAVSHNRAFERVAALLWMRAGSEGRRIQKIPAQGWEVADTYGLLIDLDRAAPFCKAVESKGTIQIAYIVTDDERRFQSVARRLPEAIEPVRLYESYLTNFRFSMGR
jgi:adenine-specific DNA-methyltransferase